MHQSAPFAVAGAESETFASAGSVKTMAFPVVVTSYEIVIADSKHLARYQWNYIVVDEGHRLKNFNCKLLRELRTIPTNNKLLLSGASPTCLDPMEHHCSDSSGGVDM